MSLKQRKLNRKMNAILALEEAGLYKTRRGSRAMKNLLSNKLAILGLVLFLFISILCFGAPLFTKFNPAKMDLRSILKGPSSTHIFGTDSIGRDLFSRVLYGGRISIAIGFGSALGATLLGVGLGCYSGYKGGWFDTVLCRLSELFSFFPQIILALLLVAMVGQSTKNIILVFIFTGWCSIFRMMRAKMLSIREEEYIQALKVQGLSELKICYKHALPNALGPIMVNITISTATFILQETALSFMGLGVPMITPTWGNILNVANDLSILKTNWWVWLPVGIFISLFVLSINFIGDGLRDSTDPLQQG
ncbi:MAG: ABC transporter permease [Sphaerochaetaceae bacterium]|nr:ABC transporter permease [Sphaerochaetaceae bacterium]